MQSTKTGIRATDAAICGSSAITCGVIDAPIATPRTVRIHWLIGPEPASGSPARAPITQAARGPNRKGKGRASHQKTSVPSPAIEIVKPRLRGVLLASQRNVVGRIGLSLRWCGSGGSGCFATIHGDHLPGHEAGFGRCEIGRHGGDVVRLPHDACRYGCGAGRIVGSGAVLADLARRDSVDRDAL